jgi:hypothetical protein
MKIKYAGSQADSTGVAKGQRVAPKADGAPFADKMDSDLLAKLELKPDFKPEVSKSPSNQAQNNQANNNKQQKKNQKKNNQQKKNKQTPPKGRANKGNNKSKK